MYTDSLELEKAVTEKYRSLCNDPDPIDFTEFEEAFATNPLNLASIATSEETELPDTPVQAEGMDLNGEPAEDSPDLEAAG